MTTWQENQLVLQASLYRSPEPIPIRRSTRHRWTCPLVGCTL